MSSVLQFPIERIYYPGIDNPLFIQDIQVANQAATYGIAMLSGLGITDFAIISGLDYVLGTTNTYTSGFIFLNGKFYYIANSFNEGLYLKANIQPTLSEAFTDGNSRNIYNEYYAATSVTSDPTYSPQFIGNMNVYRTGNKYLRDSLQPVLSVISSLGTAATRNVGNNPGNVPDAGTVYTQAQVNALLIQRTPSVVGVTMHIYDPTSAFAANFNGSGLGIVYPWLNGTERWALMDGQGGRPNMGGVSIVGIGTFTNPDTTTKVFANNASGGETDQTLTVAQIPDHNHHFKTSNNGTNNGSLQNPGWSDNESSNVGESVTNQSNAGGGSHNNMPPYRAMYIVVRIS